MLTFQIFYLEKVGQGHGYQLSQMEPFDVECLNIFHFRREATDRHTGQVSFSLAADEILRNIFAYNMKRDLSSKVFYKEKRMEKK